MVTEPQAEPPKEESVLMSSKSVLPPSSRLSGDEGRDAPDRWDRTGDGRVQRPRPPPGDGDGDGEGEDRESRDRRCFHRPGVAADPDGDVEAITRLPAHAPAGGAARRREGEGAHTTVGGNASDGGGVIATAPLSRLADGQVTLCSLPLPTKTVTPSSSLLPRLHHRQRSRSRQARPPGADPCPKREARTWSSRGKRGRAAVLTCNGKKPGTKRTTTTDPIPPAPCPLSPPCLA